MVRFVHLHLAVDAAFALGLAGCHTLRPISAVELNSTTDPQVWVTQADHPTIVLDEPRVVGDTLSGLIHGEPHRVALSDAVSLRVKRNAPIRTAAVVAISGAVLLGGMYYMEHQPDVNASAQTCETGRFGDLPVPCCQLEAMPSTPC
ncbi:MAG TPA: hypothetical protein VLV45_06090 [Gemmatimonadales bacterium]|nr:hypothetical protein [Gemmatimonadales bacterium]